MRKLEIIYSRRIVPLVIFYCLLSASVNLAENVACQQDGVCACVFGDGSKIDLSQLGSSTGVPLIKDFKRGDYMYSFNPCYSFNEETCQNVAACQSAPEKDLYFSVGDASDPVLTYNTSSGVLIGRYSSVDQITGDRKTSYVSFICDPTAETPRLEAFGESPTLTYTFAVTSKHACITREPTPPAPTKRCHTDYGDFIKRCEVEYDGHEEPVKVLFIRNWNGKCKFPSNKDVAVTIYAEKSTCAGVANRCNPAQAFSVNGEVCKGLNF